jgi:hypothetical protein
VPGVHRAVGEQCADPERAAPEVGIAVGEMQQGETDPG